MWPWIQDKKVYAYDGALVSVTNENRRHLFNKLVKQQFSLFPLFEILDKETSLLITKNSGLSPNFQDLEGSSFLKELKPYLAQSGSIRLFSLGNELSPYLKTLKEYRSFQYESGSTTDLKNIIQKNQFARDIENDHQVVLDNTGIVITAEKAHCHQKHPIT
jgi:XrtN system VIT domain protein